MAADDSHMQLVVINPVVRPLDNDEFGTSTADSTALTVVGGASRGSTTVNGNGTITDAPGFLQVGGTDTFTYRICSVAGSCDTATVTLFLSRQPRCFSRGNRDVSLAATAMFLSRQPRCFSRGNRDVSLAATAMFLSRQPRCFSRGNRDVSLAATAITQ